MQDAQKPDHVGLSSLIDKIREGRYEIPDFQREFVWNPWKIRDLMRSIFLDYYIGTLLLWKGKDENFTTLSCEPIQGFDGPRNSREYIVLDGQQRLSAMHYAFMAPDKPAPHRANRYLYFIRVDRFHDEAYDEAFVYNWTGAGKALLADTERQYREHYFPLATLGKPGYAVADWVHGYRKYWDTESERHRAAGRDTAAAEAARQKAMADEFGDHVRDVHLKYQVTYIELDRDIEIPKVCDIFQKINSTGQPLDIFDLLNAILRPKKVHLRHLWRSAKDRLAFVDAGRMNIYVLQVMSILAQEGACSPKYLYYLVPGQKRKLRRPDGSHEYRVHVANESDFNRRWNSAVEAIEESIKWLRSRYGVIAPKFLPYPSIVPAFAGIQAAAQRLPTAERLAAQQKVSCWYWASVFTSRYSSAVESTAAGDYRDLRTWFRENEKEPNVVSEFRTAVHTLDLRREASRGSAVYRGIVNLTVLSGAMDWIDGSAPSENDLDDHHIIPKAQTKKLKIDDAIDSVLNRTPLSASTNRHVIGDRLPCEYLPELIDKNGEDAVRRVFETHLISVSAFDILLRTPFTRDDFEAFLYERQQTIRREIQRLLPDGAAGPSAEALQALDRELQQVELSLRELVDTTLHGNSDLVPTNVLGNVQNRIKAAVNTDPSLDRGKAWTLRERLAYFDLRELEMTVAAKPSWPHFEAVFKSKNTLAGRFRQLAELRNRIRHHRPIDELTVKDGEAAIHWFKRVVPLHPRR